MVQRQVGRLAFFRGKTLFELCCNLKNFGKNRIVYRSKMNQNPDITEKTFYRLALVQPDMEKMLTHGQVSAEKVYRGKSYGIRKIDAAYKTDWLLVPMEEEHLYQVKGSVAKPVLKKMPIFTVNDLPPLWKMIVQKDSADKKI